jgi:hypothetical protein
MLNEDSMPGRNDPCYCGRNKKYKDCHLRNQTDYYPNESFSAKVVEIENINFVNNANGYVEVGGVDISYRNPLPWDKELESIFDPIGN